MKKLLTLLLAMVMEKQRLSEIQLTGKIQINKTRYIKTHKIRLLNSIYKCLRVFYLPSFLRYKHIFYSHF